MKTIYVEEFINVEVTDELKETQKQQKSENIVNKKPITAQTVGKYVGGALAVTATASQLYARYRSSSNAITGNSVAQRQFDNKMAYVNEGLTIGGSVGVGLIVGGIPGAVAGAIAYGTSKALQAFSISQENRVKIAQWQVESLVNQEKQNRLVKDITGIRI